MRAGDKLQGEQQSSGNNKISVKEEKGSIQTLAVQRRMSDNPNGIALVVTRGHDFPAIAVL